MSNIKLRKAGTEDSVSLAKFASETFSDTYAEFNEPKHIQGYIAAAFSPASMSEQLADSDNQFIVAERGPELIGYIKIRSTLPVENVPREGALELERIYVARQHFGHGIGRMMLDAAVAETVRRECSYLWLGVWSHNPEAVAFYRKCGFSIVGKKTFMMGDDPQEDHVMLLNIAHVYDLGSIRERLSKN